MSGNVSDTLKTVPQGSLGTTAATTTILQPSACVSQKPQSRSGVEDFVGANLYYRQIANSTFGLDINTIVLNCVNYTISIPYVTCGGRKFARLPNQDSPEDGH